MSETPIKLLVPFAVGYAITAWAARQARLAERKRNAPYRTFAAPVFEALNDPEVSHVEIYIERDPHDEEGRHWLGNREIRYKGQAR